MRIERVTVRINLGGKVGFETEKTVYLWEANLLAAIHGEANVTEGSAPFELGSGVTREVCEIDFNPKEEWEALIRRYGTATNEEGKQYVRLVYPDARSLGRFVDQNRLHDETTPRKSRQPDAIHA